MRSSQNGQIEWILVPILGLFLILLVAFGMWGCPRYGIYEQRLSGEAELAKGVAQANEIIGQSLKGNEAYLRYLWIQGLENGTAPTIVYVPTEAGLPILEAGRFGFGVTPKEK